MNTSKRRIKLIKPRLQVRLTMTFVGLAAMGLVLQFLLLMARMSKHSLGFESGGSALFEQLDSLLLGALLTAALLFLPLVFAVGILTTFRIAGPLYRIERHLEQVARGESPGKCKLRKGDDLQELCDLLNHALDRLEAERRTGTTEEGSESLETPAAEESARRPRVVA